MKIIFDTAQLDPWRVTFEDKDGQAHAVPCFSLKILLDGMVAEFKRWPGTAKELESVADSVKAAVVKGALRAPTPSIAAEVREALEAKLNEWACEIGYEDVLPVGWQDSLLAKLGGGE